MSGDRRESENSVEHTDEDPLISGEDSTLLARLKRVFPKFTLRRQPRYEEQEEQAEAGPSSQQATEDIETGRAQPNITGQSLRAEDRNIGQPLGTSGGSSSSLEEGSSPGRRGGSPGSTLESKGSGQGLLNGLMKLGGAALPSRNPSNPLNPTCLICLENLTQEEFTNGEAIVLDCECRGEVAMRHRACAEKWSQVKGNRTCDICKTVIHNLPDVPPRAPESASTPGGHMFDDGELLRNNAQVLVDQAPSGADVVFDCIRVTWIAMIISILFFGMDIANALWTGVIIGLGYTLFVRAMYRHQLAMLMREQQREREAGNSDSPRPTLVHVI